MAINPVLVRIGTVNGTPVVADISQGISGGSPILTRVTLTADYRLEWVPGWPDRPNVGGEVAKRRAVLPTGSTFDFLLPEAAALVAAGAAVFV
ncbi:hypothetical protein BTR14_20565 [Rhizobium rhizosphaerae]|uniref:Uncharacterized protein n=1 Tax=Xaviernesmea rhizosphaerae TaxID=1672749 RepID=A0ABX3P9C0_9HYPH|nr:hypothetical protein BTR14_20565 [Xaviernesmea rhizosphaerae]